MFVIIPGTFIVCFDHLPSYLLLIFIYFGSHPKSLDMNRHHFFPPGLSECCIFASSAKCLKAVAPVAAESLFHLIFSLCVLGDNSKVLSAVLGSSIFSCFNKITKMGLLPLLQLK